MTAYTGAVVQRFFGAAIFDLEGMTSPNPLAILAEHSPGGIVGHASKVSISVKDGVQLAGPVYADEPEGARVRRTSKRGFPWKASVGLNVLRWEELEAGESATVNGREITGPVSIARESRLFETSFVVNPADKATSAEAMSEETMPAETKKTEPKTEPKAAPVDESKLKQEADSTVRAELGEFLKAFPGREGWAAGKFAEGMSIVEAKAALSDVLQAELTAEREGKAKANETQAIVAELSGQTSHPGVGFSGQDRQQGTNPTHQRLSDDELAEKLWKDSPKLRAEFGQSKGAYLAIVKREGVEQFRQEALKA